MTELTHKSPRLYICEDLREGQNITLNNDQGHYLGNVLRLKEGAQIRLFNTKQGEWLAVTGVNKKKKYDATVVKQLQKPIKNNNLWLYCAPIKRAYFDFIIMKATELGVSHIAPILTARTQVREINLQRCESIAIEAAEQSERLTVPKILEPQLLADMVKTGPAGQLPLICAEFGEALPIQECLKKLSEHSYSSIAIVTGPEGGFSVEELNLLCGMPHAVAIRLGPRILRADTAAIAALSCWQAMCGDWK